MTDFKKNSLYYISSVISGVPETNIIQSINDICAVKGFVEFCKTDKCVPAEHELIRIGSLDENNNIIDSTRYVVCRGDKAEDVYKEMFDSIVGDD